MPGPTEQEIWQFEARSLSLRSLSHQLTVWLNWRLKIAVERLEVASENIERQMEFLRQEQGRGAARLGQLEDLVVRFAQATRDRFEAHNQRFEDVDQKIAAIVDSQVRAEERSHEIDERIAALVESQLRTEANVKKTDENVKNTEMNVKKTDETLRKLITTVDRHLSDGRNENP